MSKLTNNSHQRYSIIGAGASGIFLALDLLKKGFAVDLYDHSGGALKKFLIAGKGGLNLTHSEELKSFVQKYGKNHSRFELYLENFSNIELIRWLSDYGIETFVGSSKRIFPKELTAGEILKIWLDKCKSYSQFKLYTKHSFVDFRTGIILENEKGIELNLGKEQIILALGGASYKHTGSDGKWKEVLDSMGIQTEEFVAINCGYEVNWSSEFTQATAHKPLKNISITVNHQIVRGEVLFTEYGIEGSGIYAQSRLINEVIKDNQTCTIHIDLKPDLSIDQIRKKFDKRQNKNSYTNFIRKCLNLDPLAIALIKWNSTKNEFENIEVLIALIKDCSIQLLRARPLDQAISNAGGISFDEVNEDLSLKQYPGIYVIGEMLNWDAPTGGYLLQGCLSMAAWVSKNIKTH